MISRVDAVKGRGATGSTWKGIAQREAYFFQNLAFLCYGKEGKSPKT